MHNLFSFQNYFKYVPRGRTIGQSLFIHLWITVHCQYILNINGCKTYASGQDWGTGIKFSLLLKSYKLSVLLWENSQITTGKGTLGRARELSDSLSWKTWESKVDRVHRTGYETELSRERHWKSTEVSPVWVFSRVLISACKYLRPGKEPSKRIGRKIPSAHTGLFPPD